MNNEAIIVSSIYLLSVFLFYVFFIVFTIRDLIDDKYKVTFHNIMVRILREDELITAVIFSVFPILNTLIIVLWIIFFMFYMIGYCFEKFIENLKSKYNKEK